MDTHASPSRVTHPESAAEPLNSLLRGEIAAVETYVRALGQLKDRPVQECLRRLRDDHVEAANVLRGLVRVGGGESATDSGIWGAFAKAFEGAAALAGEAAILKALREGEEHGVSCYERVLEGALEPWARERIERLLPRQLTHADEIDRILTSA